jgi:hypothetical protein
MNRREMLRNSATGIALTGTLSVAALESACNAGSWISIALADLPTILQIVTSILSVATAAQGGTVPPNVLSKVTEYGNDAKIALQTAQSVITSYQTAQGSAKPGLLGQIDSALTAAQQNLSGILGVFYVNDPTLQATIAAAVGSAITVVLAIEALVPAPPAPTPAKVRLLAAKKANNGSAVMREAYNVIVGRAYPNYVIR